MLGLPVLTLNCVPETVTAVLAATSVRFGRDMSREDAKRTSRSGRSDHARLNAGSTSLYQRFALIGSSVEEQPVEDWLVLTTRTPTLPRSSRESSCVSQ